ncbi:MAG: hypothetical protein RRY34_00945, partial [Victivallaceae bacterium]
ASTPELSYCLKRTVLGFSADSVMASSFPQAPNSLAVGDGLVVVRLRVYGKPSSAGKASAISPCMTPV